MFIVSEKQETQTLYLEIAYFNLCAFRKSVISAKHGKISVKILKKPTAWVPGEIY